MGFDWRRSREPVDVYRALVADLAYSHVPTVVMALLLIGIGTYAFVRSGDNTIAVLVIISVIANIAKIVFSARHRAFLARREATLHESRRFELGHAATTLSLAGATGALVSSWFTEPDVSLHLIATALLFGYCAGIVSRVSVRPFMAAAAVSIASLPVIVVCVYAGSNGRLLVGVVFLIFLTGSMETIGHAYGNARRHIELRLVMASLAHHDPLTQLCNRLGLTTAFGEMKRTESHSVALHAFDLDGFKAVNDQYGHEAGDQLLQALSDRLREALPDDTTITARIGGDEFVVVQGNVRNAQAPAAMAKHLYELLSQPYMLDGVCTQKIGLSIGYAVARANQAELDDLLRRADRACYAAKRAGGGVRRALRMAK
ncbi:GGDEF domain-containing protein [Salinisphaera sp. Q1T1-3]|uniref:GGDEF domain-containing protein n=1 Tax=Salinisphaera sp. Q1T1-3 TaxID=2321229 RepID=UPI000E76FD5C|nr:GGDEF domain-containing protein [Salinisphaera sp. Q1T1-3]RJS93240.1 GGDEF domain-containing protein [Salinisphaera sp. Q1T1-3]